MLTADFDYDLPAEAIAQHPLPRGHSRLLVVDATGEERHRRVADLPALLAPGDLVVVNNTRVIPARLFAHRADTGGALEILLLERLSEREWLALLGPARRARPGVRLELGEGLAAEVVASGPEGRRRLRFSGAVEPHLDRLGHVPLPPYIRRPDDAADRRLYQTVFATVPGAVAAPTAGLHFDEALLAALAQRGIEVVEITLHVGLGTFKPVTAERPAEHRMEAERFAIPKPAAAALAAARRAGRRVVAVGTTVVRTLESAALQGAGEIRPGPGSTDLFITPGFPFRVVDVLLTNFHLPRSTLLMLVCAFAGQERVLAAYREAVARGYRFYSYGDAMLLERRRSD